MKRIAQIQLYALFTQFLFSTAIGFLIQPIVRFAGYMSWLCIVLGGVMGLFFVYCSYLLVMRRPGEYLGHYGRKILGRWLHYLLFALAILIQLYIASLILRELTDFIVQIYLPGTPDWAVAALFGLCVARGVRSGPANLFRSAQGLFLFSVVSALIFPMFVIKEVDSEKFLALLTDFQPHGFWDGTMLSAALFGEMAFIVYLNPHFERREKSFRTLILASATAIVVTLANMITPLLLFGSELTAGLTYPTLEMIRYIRPGSFLENLDPLLIVFWLFSMLIKIALFLLVCTLMTTHLFGFNDPKPFSNAVSAAAIVLSIVLFDSMSDIDWLTIYAAPAMLLIKAGMPMIYLVVDRLRYGSKPASGAG